MFNRGIKKDTKRKEDIYDLINNYPDMEVLERLNCKHYNSIKTMMKKEIDRITVLYQDFIAEKDCIFVLNSLTIWHERIKDQNFTRNLDMTDMMGNGYYLVDGSPNFVLYHIYDYDSFEYFEGKLEKNNRILKLISSFLKGKIDNLELFIKAYESFKSDYEGKMPDIFIDENLRLAGFNDVDISKIHYMQDKIYNMPENKRDLYV